MRSPLTRKWIAAALAVAVLSPGVSSMVQAAEPTGQRHIVEIRKFKFHPAKLKVSPGDVIVWINHDFVPHTATAGDKSWDSQSIAKSAKWETVVKEGMSEMYLCRFHTTMKASLQIVPK